MNPYEPHIRLELEDREDSSKWIPIDSWEEYTLSHSVWQPCDNFSLQPVPSLYPKFLAGNQKVRIWMDDALQFTGITDEVDHDSDWNGRDLAITGRDMGACIFDATAEPAHLGSLTLAELAHNQCDPWMPYWILSVVTDNAPNFYRLIGRKSRAIKIKIPFLDRVTFEITQKEIVIGRTAGVKGGKSSPYYRGVDQDRLRSNYIEGSEKIWGVLEEHAKRIACAMWMTCDGSLFIGRPRYDETVHEPTLIYDGTNRGNVRSAHFRKATAERFSDWKLLAQGAGRKGAKGKSIIGHKVHVRDPGSAFYKLQTDGTLLRRFYRPTTIKIDKGCQDEKLLRRMARTQMEWSALQTYDYSVLVSGHTWPYDSKDAPFWATDCCVDVKDTVHGIEGSHYIVSVNETRSKDRGVETRLQLIPSGIWLALDHDELNDKEYDEYMRWRIWW